MIESRCGILCNECEYKEELNCKGCLNIDKPFWGDKCPLKSCCEEKDFLHCGECDVFPCELLEKFAYDEEQGDNGKRIEQCRKWMKEESQIKTDLQEIPGVGEKIEQHLIKIGYNSVESLKGEDPEFLYERVCDIKGHQVDRCLLYVFRCAVYYAENDRHDTEKLKWWNWKDE